jgi:hypothetical protein
MVDENAGHDDKYDPANEPNQKSTHPEVMPTPVGPEHDHEDSDAHHNNPKDKDNPTKWETFHERLKKVGFHDWVMLAATITIAISTTLYTVYAHGQLDTMQKTLAEMRRSGIAATDQMWQAVGNINWLARSMNSALSQNTDAMESSEKKAKEAMEVTRHAFQVDQRPYIVIDTPKFTDTFLPRIGGQIKANVRPRNIGKTPAVDARTYARFVRFQASAFANADDIRIFFDNIFLGLRQQATKRWSAQESAKTLFFRQDLGNAR